MSKRLGTIQQKILLLLLGGITLGLSRSPRAYFKILGDIHTEWKNIDRRSLAIAIQGLYKNKLVTLKEHGDGTITMTLSSEGNKTAKLLTYDIHNMRITHPAQWDGKWRMVIFDIPHSMKRARDAFRFHLHRLGMYPLQKSIFICPFPCTDEIEFLIEFFQVRRFVRQITAEYIDNELHLKNIFKISSP